MKLSRLATFSMRGIGSLAAADISRRERGPDPSMPRREPGGINDSSAKGRCGAHEVFSCMAHSPQ